MRNTEGMTADELRSHKQNLHLFDFYRQHGLNKTTAHHSEISSDLNIAAEDNILRPQYRNNRCNGTDGWTRHSLMRRLVYSDGVKVMAEDLQAYWLIDIVASYIPNMTRIFFTEDSNLFFVELEVKFSEKAKFRIHDGGVNNQPCKNLIVQRIPFCDSTNCVKMYLAYEEEGTETIWKLYLPSEA